MFAYKGFYKCLLSLALCIFSLSQVKAQTTFYVLRDSTHQLTPTQLVQPEWQKQFIPAESENLSFGFSPDDYWIRFTLPKKENESYLLECVSPFVQYIDLYYLKSDGTWEVKKGGYDVLWKDKEVKHRFPAFQLPQPGEYYIKIRNNGLSFPLRVLSTQSFEEIYLKQHLFFGLLLGTLLVVVVINFYFSVSLRSYTHFVYALLALSYIIFDMAGEGYLYYLITDSAFLSRNYNSFSNVIEAFSYSLIVYYVIVFFKIPFKSVWYKFFILILVFWTVHALNYNNAVLSTILVEWGATIGFTFTMLMAARGIYIHYPGSWIFFTAYATYFLFGIVETIHLNGYFPDLLPVSYIVMGSQFEVLILGYGLASATTREREILREQKEKAEHEKLELAQNQNEKLAQLVDEKTRELSAANEELTSTNEELHEQHQILEAQKLEVETAHRLIEQHNEKLEKEVTQRTARLIDYNQQLEQFSFITAHNLRAPVARILGIGQLLKTKVDSETSDKLIDGLLKSCTDLDTVIHDLNTILIVRKDEQKEFTEINLQQTLTKILESLHDEVQNSKTKIEHDFSKVNTVNGIQPYVESIFLNLIHNAIKYRDPERALHIKINSFSETRNIGVSVSDNGLGIDLNKHRDKVFTLYKRFHTHIEGKGMGLFLVRSQMEAMHGSISVESEVNKGTTFTITFPKANTVSVAES